MALWLVIKRLVAVAFIVGFAASASAAQEKHGAPRLVSIRIAPQDASVWGAQASQRFVVLGKYADGLERELTSASRFLLSDPLKGEVDSTGKFVARGR